MTVALLEPVADTFGATTEYGWELSVQLGIGRQDEAGVWDGSQWDDEVWTRTDTALGDWVDVTCSTETPIQLSAGSSDADGVVTRWEAATCHLTLWGAEWDPWGGPYAGILGPQVALRVLARKAGAADWSPVFTGTTTADGWVWQPGTRPSAVVSASDPVQVLATADGPEQPAVGQGETASARVTRILDAASFPRPSAISRREASP